MEEYCKIFNLTRRETRETNYFQGNLKNGNQIETKIIKKEQKNSRQIKLNQISDIQDYKKEISSTQRTLSKIKLTYGKFELKEILEPFDSKNFSRTKSYFQIKFKKFYNFLRFIISLFFFSSLFDKLNQKEIIYKSTEITLLVNGTGYIKILSDSFFKRYNQCEIYIDGILQNITKNEYYFGEFELTNLYNFNNSEIELSNILQNELYINNSKIYSSDNPLNDYNFSINSYLNYYNISEKNNLTSSNNKTNYEKLNDIYEIKIIWDNTFTTTDCMFLNCSKIIDIDYLILIQLKLLICIECFMDVLL